MRHFLFNTIVLVSCMFALSSCNDYDEYVASTANSKLMTRAGGKHDYYYWYNGSKIGISSINNRFYISSNDSMLLVNTSLSNSVVSTVSDIASSVNMVNEKTYWKIIDISSLTSSTINSIKDLQNKTKEKDIYIAPVFGNSEQYVPTSEFFYVQLKDINDYSKLENVAKKNNSIILGPVAYMPNWYTIKSPHSSNGLTMSNIFYETGYFKAVDPGFMFNFNNNSCVSDPEADNQWGLNAVNACEAWNLTKGKGAVVAVLDQGIDSKHREFENNYSSLSYDLVTKTTPTTVYGDHGTHVSGIIGANHNGRQIAGLAPEATLVSLSHPLTIGTNATAQMASGFGYAVAHGVDVINNSWGDQGGFLYQQMHSSILEDGIQNALVNGRNGKGMVVVFASGNHTGKAIDYPGRIFPKALIVGSSSSNSKRSSDFSSYGKELDVVAPGKDILSTLPNNRTGTKSGTSMAAPHASAIAALILSINPNLSNTEVTDIIEKTASKGGGYSYTTTQDRPNGTWNEEMGYGICNAYAAVLAARTNDNVIQLIDKTISTDFTFSGENIYTRNITIINNALFNLLFGNELTIDKPFTVNKGSIIDISIKNR